MMRASHGPICYTLYAQSRLHT